MVHGACGVVSGHSKAFASTWRSRHTATDDDTSSRFSPINLDEEIALACGNAVILKCKSVVLGRGGVSWVGPPYRMTMSYI